MLKIENAAKKFLRNRNTGQESKFWTKIEHFVKNRNVGQKSIRSRFSIIDQNFDWVTFFRFFYNQFCTINKYLEFKLTLGLFLLLIIIFSVIKISPFLFFVPFQIFRIRFWFSKAKKYKKINYKEFWPKKGITLSIMELPKEWGEK